MNKTISDNPDYEDYIDLGDERVESFQQEYSREWELFNGFDREIIGIIDHIRARRKLFPSYEHADVMLKLSIVTHRQSRNGFYLMMRQQSYDGMLIFRRSLEASIHAFRIFKDPTLVNVYLAVNKTKSNWTDTSEWKSFRKEFLKAHLPQDLPSREGVKEFKKILNQNFSHPDKQFITYSLDEEDGRSDFHYFDRNKDLIILNLLLFLAHYRNCILIWRTIMGDLLPINMQSPNSNWSQIGNKFSSFWESHRKLLEKYRI